MPTNGVGNITNSPAFADFAGGNYRLQTNSPCINAGTNYYSGITSGVDLDGDPRVVGISVDMGAYEYQGPTSILPYVWLLQYGLPTDGSVDFVDTDGDGLNNWQEWRTGTDPTDPLSVLKIISLSKSVSGVTVTWLSETNKTYFVQRKLNLTSTFVTIRQNIVGQAGTTTNKDTTADGAPQWFYRVGVQ